MAVLFKYSIVNEAPIYESLENGTGKEIINRILSGTYAEITDESGDFYKVKTAGPGGWMKKNTLGDEMGIKIFYLDVGQGDGALIETGKLRILIDAGPGSNMHSYLTKWQYKYLLDKNEKIHIDHVFISHFDMDHFKGFIRMMENENFTFGTIYHAGILKFASNGNPYSTGLGDTIESGGKTYLVKLFDNLLTMVEPAAFNRDVTAFINALKLMKNQGRIGNVTRIKKGDVPIEKNIEGKLFKIEVLGPVTEKINNKNTFRIFSSDDGKTINGHSLVLKLTFGNRTFLFGGDLNTDSEKFLMDIYGNENPFKVDVAKSCHHGSSDFTETFMNLISPYATVISSGDNEQHSHPRADAVGCAGRYSRGDRPLVYSTELARSTNLNNNTILFGLINLRCNGNKIYLSQMKEAGAANDKWDSYEVVQY